MNPLRRMLPGLLALLPRPATAADRLALPDEAARARADTLIAEIDAQLRLSDSATLTLERWCAAHGMARPARILVARERVQSGLVQTVEAACTAMFAYRGEEWARGFRHVRS